MSYTGGIGKLVGAVLSLDDAHDHGRRISEVWTTLLPAGRHCDVDRAPIWHAACGGSTTCINHRLQRLMLQLLDSGFFYWHWESLPRLELSMHAASRYSPSGAPIVGYARLFPGASADVEEQRAIADFLDRETARIDELIARQAVLDSLLDESRRSIVSKRSCRGMDPNGIQ